MSLTELMSWVEYYQEEPWGEALNGIRMATVAASSLNAGLMMAAPKELKRNQFKPEDFYVGVKKIEKQPKQQTWEQQKQMLEMVFGKPKKLKKDDYADR